MCRILRPADDKAAPHSLDKGPDFVSRRGAAAQAPLEEWRMCRIFRPADVKPTKAYRVYVEEI